MERHRYSEHATRRECWKYVKRATRPAWAEVVFGVLAGGIASLVQRFMSGTDVWVPLVAGILGAIAIFLLRGLYHLWLSPAVVADEAYESLSVAYQQRGDELRELERDVEALRSRLDEKEEVVAQLRERRDDEWEQRLRNLRRELITPFLEGLKEAYRRFRDRPNERNPLASAAIHLQKECEEGNWPLRPGYNGLTNPYTFARHVYPPDEGRLGLMGDTKETWRQFHELRGRLKDELESIADALHTSPAIDKKVRENLGLHVWTIKLLMYLEIALAERLLTRGDLNLDRLYKLAAFLMDVEEDEATWNLSL